MQDCFKGVLSPPPKVRSRPFEIIFETPQAAPKLFAADRMIAMLQSVLSEYRKFIAYGRNL